MSVEITKLKKQLQWHFFHAKLQNFFHSFLLVMLEISIVSTRRSMFGPSRCKISRAPCCVDNLCVDHVMHLLWNAQWKEKPWKMTLFSFHAIAIDRTTETLIHISTDFELSIETLFFKAFPEVDSSMDTTDGTESIEIHWLFFTVSIFISLQRFNSDNVVQQMIPWWCVFKSGQHTQLFDVCNPLFSIINVMSQSGCQFSSACIQTRDSVVATDQPKKTAESSCSIINIVSQSACHFHLLVEFRWRSCGHWWHFLQQKQQKLFMLVGVMDFLQTFVQGSLKTWWGLEQDKTGMTMQSDWHWGTFAEGTIFCKWFWERMLGEMHCRCNICCSKGSRTSWFFDLIMAEDGMERGLSHQWDRRSFIFETQELMTWLSMVWSNMPSSTCRSPCSLTCCFDQKLVHTKMIDGFEWFGSFPQTMGDAPIGTKYGTYSYVR